MEEDTHVVQAEDKNSEVTMESNWLPVTEGAALDGIGDTSGKTEGDKQTHDGEVKAEDESGVKKEPADIHVNDKEMVKSTQSEPSSEKNKDNDKVVKEQDNVNVDKNPAEGQDKENADKLTAEEQDTVNDDKSKTGTREPVCLEMVEKRRNYKENRDNRIKAIPYPESFDRFRHMTVNIGPIKMEDLKTQALHNILCVSNSHFELTFDRKENPEPAENESGEKKPFAKSEYVGYVNIIFEVDKPGTLTFIYNKLSTLNINERDIPVTLPEQLKEAIDDMKAYRKKIDEVHEKCNEERFQEMMRSLRLRSLPNPVDTDTLKALFPEAIEISVSNFESKVRGAMVVFETREEAKKALEAKRDVTIGNKKLNVSLSIRNDNVVRRENRGDNLPMEFVGRASGGRQPRQQESVDKDPPPGARRKRKRARLIAKLDQAETVTSPAGSSFKADQSSPGGGATGGRGGKKRRKRQFNRQDSGQPRSLLGPAPVQMPGEADTMSMMAYMKSSLVRMEQQLVHGQRSHTGGYMEDRYNDSYGGNNDYNRPRYDNYMSQSYSSGGQMGMGRQSYSSGGQMGMGQMGYGFGNGPAEFGNGPMQYGNEQMDSYGSGGNFGSQGGKGRNRRKGKNKRGNFQY